MSRSRRLLAPLFCAAALAVAAPASAFPDLPLPPETGGLIAFPQTYRAERSAHLALVLREAERHGFPAAVADAVAQVESAYNPNAVGAVGEIGLMQIRPTTAAMLGYRGPVTGLFDPETNVRYSVEYLAGAWRLAGGDLCRALMKYRAGHGEERMTPLSIEYCRRARGHLAAIGSPLGAGAAPTPVVTARRTPGALRVAAIGPAKLSEAQAKALERDRVRRAKSRQMWATHRSRLQAIEARIKPAQLRIATGL